MTWKLSKTWAATTVVDSLWKTVFGRIMAKNKKKKRFYCLSTNFFKGQFWKSNLFLSKALVYTLTRGVNSLVLDKTFKKKSRNYNFFKIVFIIISNAQVKSPLSYEFIVSHFLKRKVEKVLQSYRLNRNFKTLIIAINCGLR